MSRTEPVYARFYDRFAPGLPGDVDFYVRQAERWGGPVLYLGCGTGRILAPIAGIGTPVVGLDKSPAMLSLAAAKLGALLASPQTHVTLHEGDMRDFALGRRFQLVIAPYRVLQALLTPEDQLQALRCVRRHLLDTGRFVFDIPDPRLDLLASQFGPLGGALREYPAFVHPENGHRVVVWGSGRYDPGTQVVNHCFTFEELSPEGMTLVKSYSTLVLRHTFRYEMQHLLRVAGFEVEDLYGDFTAGPFRPGGEQVWVTRLSEAGNRSESTTH